MQLGTKLRFCLEESGQHCVKSKSTATFRVSGINQAQDVTLPAMSLAREPKAAVPKECRTETFAKLQEELNFNPVPSAMLFNTSSKEARVLFWTVDFIRNFLLIHQ